MPPQAHEFLPLVQQNQQRTQQQRQPQSSEFVPDWLRLAILQKLRSKMDRELDKYKLTSTPTSLESNADNQKTNSHLASHSLQDTSKNELKPSSLVQSDEAANNTDENHQAEKSKTDPASNNLCEKNPYPPSMMAGLEENKHATIDQVSKNPQERNYSRLTEVDVEAIVILTAMRFYHDCLDAMYGSEKNCTVKNSNK